MLNLKSLWMYRTNTSKPEKTNVYKGRKNLHDQCSMKINMSKGLVNHTFAYQSILTARWMSRNCWRVILLPREWEQCSLEAWTIWLEHQRLGKEEEQPLDCLCAWAAWACGAMALSLSLSLSLFPSFFLSFSSLFFFFYNFSLFLSLSLFFLFFLFFQSKPRLTPSWNKDTPLVGWNLQRDA